MELPVLLQSPSCMHAVAYYPGGIPGCTLRSLPLEWQPSPRIGRVGFRITVFEACSTFTARYGLHTRWITK